MMATNIPKMPTGTFTKNTDLHPNEFISNPPKAGPMINPVPTTLKWLPNAFPLSEDENVEIMIAMAFA
jgi:hypothetical protein